MRFDWKAVLGVAITVFLIWWVLHDQDPAEVLRNVLRGDMRLLAAAVAVATFGFVIRAARWRILLDPVCPGTSFRSRFAAVSIGFMANNVLPARMGEFARAYALSRTDPISATAAFGTLVVERVLDGIVLIGLLILAVNWPTFPAEGVLEGTVVGAVLDGFVVLLVVLIAGMVAFLVKPLPVIRLAERVAARLPGDFARPVVGTLESLLDSLAILRRPGLLLQAAAWTVGFWLWHGYSFYLAMLAYDVRPGEDPFIAALFTEAVVGFGIAAPAAPGFVGTFHAAAEFALSTVYGVAEADSLAFAFGYHFGGWVPITAIGLWYVWKLGLRMSDVAESEERVETAVETEHPEVAAILGPRSWSGAEGEQSSSTPPAILRASEVRVRAPAKVNLFLRVLRRDPATGYHDIETLFQALELSDAVTVEVEEGDGGLAAPADAVFLTVLGMDIGPPRENLVHRAAVAYLKALGGDNPRLHVTLEKWIPAGAGLGGGSSDAAATLRALEAAFGHPLGAERIRDIGAALGSDVPFFLQPTPLAFASGRGERLTALPSLPSAPVVVVVPPFPIETAYAYEKLADVRGSGAPAPSGQARPPHPRSWSAVLDIVANDFEEVLFDLHPPLPALRDALSATDPRFTLLSGSGSALFAVYRDEGAAHAAAAAVQAGHPGATVIATATATATPPVETDHT